MSAQAVKLMDLHSARAKERMAGGEVAPMARRARGDLEGATHFGMCILIESGVDIGAAAKKMLDPEMALMIETSADRVAMSYYDVMDYDFAAEFNQSGMEALDAIVHDAMGHLALWSFEDGSAWVALRGHERELAWEALETTGFAKKNELGKMLWALWDRAHAPFAMQAGQKFSHARRGAEPMVALNAAEAKALIDGLAAGWAHEGTAWGKGFSAKTHATGAAVAPAEFIKVGHKALSKGKDELVRASQKRMEVIKKERDSRLKIHWRDAMSALMAQSEAMPVYDAGFASFLMTKQGLFGKYPLPVWRKMFFEAVEHIKTLGEGESPEYAKIEHIAAILGSELSSQLAHFLYRYHRAGGAKLTAKRVLEQTRDRMATEASKTGLAAAVKTKEPVTEEMREASKAASSVEFSAQYGAALALYAGLWARETGFDDISVQARAVVKTMRGAGEISMECFGWFARILHDFSEGFVSKEDVAAALKAEMDSAAKLAEEEKRRGGKITIENEWSGNWGSELANRKVREYLGLERSK